MNNLSKPVSRGVGAMLMLVGFIGPWLMWLFLSVAPGAGGVHSMELPWPDGSPPPTESSPGPGGGSGGGGGSSGGW